MLWLGVTRDLVSKRVLVLHRGARTQVAAHAVIHELQQCLAPNCLPICTSDGLNLYFHALTAHFGAWVAGIGSDARPWQVAAELLDGQVKKTYCTVFYPRDWLAS